MLKRRVWLVPVLCILIGAILRIARFPQGDSPGQPDEVSYLSNGLLLLEGETSINKYAPSGPLTWLSAAYGAFDALYKMVAGEADIAAFPWLLRPAAALQSALFDLYADMAGLRLTAAAVTVLITLAGIAAACRLGKSLGGAPGQILAGLMAASLPIFVEMSTETRPYASAWAFALMALASAGAAKQGGRTLGTGILLGLAVGSHIDMIRIVPLIPLLRWRRTESSRPPWAEFGRTAGIATITFLIVAPWYLLHVLDNIRQIVSVRVLAVVTVEYSAFSSSWFQVCFVLPLAVTLLGLILGWLRRDWPAFACGIWLALNTVVALRPSQHGLQHDGALLVMIVALVPLGFSILSDLTPPLRKPALGCVLVFTIAAPCVWQGVKTAFIYGRSLQPDQAIAWIEANVPAGTPVYVDYGGFRTPLPTAEAADRLWADVAAPEAWLGKYRHDMARFSFGDVPPLRVMSTDRLTSDRGNRRRLYILGAAGQPGRPRYDLWMSSYGSFFDLTPETVIGRLCAGGGVYLLSGAEQMKSLPAPVMIWKRSDGNWTRIYRVAPGDCAN
jgi:hypothetical protein